MDNAILKHNNHWKEPYSGLQTRDVLASIVSRLHLRQIQVLKGIRRAGKTTLFKLLINHLAKEFQAKSILYINLDDPYFSELYRNIERELQGLKKLKIKSDERYIITYNQSEEHQDGINIISFWDYFSAISR